MVNPKSLLNLRPPIKKGEVRNPHGRPKGKTLKEYARQMFSEMTDEEKKKWLKKVHPDIIWRMSEGNPHNTDDITSKGDKIKSVVYLPMREKKE